MRTLYKAASMALAGGLLMSSMTAQAAFSDQDTRAVSGTQACGGNHFNRLNGTEAQRTTWVLRNYGDTPIRIEQMTLYDANGVILFSASGASLPVFRNSVLGPGDNIIAPNETTQINSDDILGDSGLGSNVRPITMKFDWAADSRTLLPEFNWVRYARKRQQVIDPGTGEVSWQLREERGRHLNNCRSIRIDKGRGGDRDGD